MPLNKETKPNLILYNHLQKKEKKSQETILKKCKYKFVFIYFINENVRYILCLEFWKCKYEYKKKLHKKCQYKHTIKTPYILLPNCLAFNNPRCIPVSRGCRICQLYLCWGVRPPPWFNECPGHDIKLPNGKAPFLELWGMCSTPSLPLFLGSLWPRVVIPVRVPSMDQIELLNHLTVCKQMINIE